MNAGPASRESAQSPWFQRPADPANRGSPEEIARSFTGSQQAGLAAAIALAQADAAAAARTAPRSRTPRHQSQASLRGSAVGTAPARPAAAPDLADTAVDLPSYTADPAADWADDWPAARTGEQQGIGQPSHRLGYLQTPLLMVILTVQAVLSLRLIWSNTAFLNEASYLLAGRVEIAHWLHGTPVPAYPAFPGSPVIYPPVAALAARLGGLAAARILSLLFMLAATALLWSMTRKLFGAAAAVCAATLFALTGPTLHLGAFATFDGMALLLLAASAWCLVSARDRPDSALLLIAGIVLLILANATEYSTMIFDPSVVAIAGLAIAAKHGAKPAVARSGYVAAVVVGLTSALLALAGPSSAADVLASVGRGDGIRAALTVLTGEWKWTGLLFAITAAGVLLSVFRRRHRIESLILVMLATAAALALLTRASIQTKIALSEHIGFGVWFAAAAAGYAISRLSRVSRRRPVHFALAALIVTGIAVPAATAASARARAMFGEWPNAAPVVAALRTITHQHPGQYLAEDYDVPAYYLGSTTSWQQWWGTWYFSYTPPGSHRRLTGPAAYRAAINHHYFSVVVLDFQDTSQTDAEIAADLDQSPDYQFSKVVHSSTGQYTIWVYQPPRQQPGAPS